MNDTSVAAKELDQVADSLELLADLSRDFASGMDLDQTLLRAVDRITDYLEAAGGALFMLVDDSTILECQASVGATDITGVRIPSDHGIVGRSVQSDTGEIVRDVSKDPSFDGSVDAKTGYTTKSILCAPLSVGGDTIGAIELINKLSRDGLFDDADLRMLETLASSAALAIINARQAAALVDQERLKRELELAAEIQRSLLPQAPADDFPVHGINLPARTVSGDFYDFLSCPDGNIAFCLGDVSGKGMNAALLMAKTASLFRAFSKDGMPPGQLLTRLNNEIFETATRGMFVTMLSGVLNPETGTAVIANAGHEPPLLHTSNGEFESFEAAAPPLGIMPMEINSGMDETTVNLEGGTLYIFTDGVTEGTTSSGEMLGADGLKSLLSGAAQEDVGKRLQTVADAVSGGVLHDDVTLLAVEGAA